MLYKQYAARDHCLVSKASNQSFNVVFGSFLMKHSVLLACGGEIIPYKASIAWSIEFLSTNSNASTTYISFWLGWSDFDLKHL